MGHLVLSAVGADRPGIVSAVTAELVELGCNLEDTAMTVLRGRFAMVLVLAAPDTVGPAEVEAALAPVAERLDLAVWVHPVGESVPAAPEGEPWTVSVHGSDHPGIVHRVTAVLAAVGADIVDLSTRVIGPEDDPVYAMVLEVLVPEGVDGPALAASLERLGSEIGVACSMHPAGADLL
ncbi:MAG TPA: ACT domain-containing protein [Acidimicrobiales bacterium]|nr:ACT domain-containing protein [Acidimicrobiales bacterium]